jgi:hypothetical protein
MKLKTIKNKADREVAIKWLCQKDFDFIINENNGAGLELLDSILDSGFKGYGNYSDRELNDAIAERKEMERMFG